MPSDLVTSAVAPLLALDPITRPPPLRAADFAGRPDHLRRKYPCAFDSTTNEGMGPLQRALPDWIDALLAARAALPLPSRDSSLDELLRWGTSRCIPGSARQVRTAAKRRRALKQFLGFDVPPLGRLDSVALATLEQAYRARARERPGTLVSEDLTELRVLVTEARAAAGLPPLGEPRPASKVHGVPPARPIASLHDVSAAMQSALMLHKPRLRGGRVLRTEWLLAYLALQLALPLMPSEVLALRRWNIQGDRVVLDVDDAPRRSGKALHLRLGLPAWASDALETGLDGWRDLPDDALLFPGRGSRPRTDLHRVLGIVCLDVGVDGLTPLAVRRLGQSIHRRMGAARAVVRATASSSGGAQEPDDALLLAQEEHAAEVVRRWPNMMSPPDEGPRPLPQRAPAGLAPSEPEFGEHWVPRVMPASCVELAEAVAPMRGATRETEAPGVSPIAESGLGPGEPVAPTVNGISATARGKAVPQGKGARRSPGALAEAAARRATSRVRHARALLQRREAELDAAKRLEVVVEPEARGVGTRVEKVAAWGAGETPKVKAGEPGSTVAQAQGAVRQASSELKRAITLSERREAELLAIQQAEVVAKREARFAEARAAKAAAKQAEEAAAKLALERAVVERDVARLVRARWKAGGGRY